MIKAGSPGRGRQTQSATARGVRECHARCNPSPGSCARVSSPHETETRAAWPLATSFFQTIHCSVAVGEICVILQTPLVCPYRNNYAHTGGLPSNDSLADGYCSALAPPADTWVGSTCAGSWACALSRCSASRALRHRPVAKCEYLTHRDVRPCIRI